MSIDANSWEGNCQSSESTLHQLAPYIGKMKSAMARCLIESFTHLGDLILDPFVGSGVVALESLILNRGITCCDINPYAITLTKAKLNAPPTLEEALARVGQYLSYMKRTSHLACLDPVPSWVKQFFYPETLQEIITLAGLLRTNEEHFLLACLLGILHHQRPGFLSFPASHLVPYLRTQKFPEETYPELYAYRDVGPRLENKIRRIYRRFPKIDHHLSKECIQCDAASLNLPAESVDAIITSPPYMNALSYGRDNRLRLWFLGVNDYYYFDQVTPKNLEGFRLLMTKCLMNFQKALRPRGACILVLGEVKRAKEIIDIAQLVIEIAMKEVEGYNCEEVIGDAVPDIRRARKGVAGVKREWVVVLRKKG
jgi:hypothetical protein